MKKIILILIAALTGVIALPAQNVFVANDSTHAVPVTSTGSTVTAATGSPVPAAAAYEGLNVSGTLRGMTGVNPSGVVYAQQADIASVAGTTTAVNAGAASAGTLRVVPANDAPSVSTIGSAVPARGVFNSGIATTANPTNATAGNAVGQMFDKAGRNVITTGNVRELIGVQTTTITASTAETTIVSAGGAGVFNDISSINISTTNTAIAVLTLKDATSGTIRAVWNYPATAANPVMPLVIPFPIPMSQAAAANNWTLTCSVNAGNFIVNVVYVKNL